MARRWVVNASPVIALAKIGHVELLSMLCDELVIPPVVAHEVRAGDISGAGDISDTPHQWIQTDGKRHVGDPSPDVAAVRNGDLGAGETAVLAWAYRHRTFEAIIDDRAARICAEALNIPVRGTLGILVLAKKEQLVDQARPLIDALVDVGLYVSPALRDHILHLTGEAE